MLLCSTIPAHLTNPFEIQRFLFINLLQSGFGCQRPIFQYFGPSHKPTRNTTPSLYKSAPKRLWRPAAHIPLSWPPAQTYRKSYPYSIIMPPCLVDSPTHGYFLGLPFRVLCLMCLFRGKRGVSQKSSFIRTPVHFLRHQLFMQ